HLNTFSPPPVLNTHDRQGEFLRTDAQRNSLKARISFGMHLDLSISANALIDLEDAFWASDRQPGNYCCKSGKAMARTGLRMMPTFPSPPLKFRTAGFPQYGFKAGLSEGAFPARRPIVTPIWFASLLRTPRFQTCLSPLDVGAVVRWSAAIRATVVALPQGSSLRSGFFCPGPST